MTAMVNTPISEAGLMGAALGAALMGMRPIADVQYADFLFCAMDQVANQVAKMRYMSGGKLEVPWSCAPRRGDGRGAQHAQMRSRTSSRSRHQDRVPRDSLRCQGTAEGGGA